VRGDTVELCPAYTEDAVRVEFFGDEIDRLTRFDPISGETQETLEQMFTFFAARHYVTPADKMRIAMGTIRAELDERIAELEKQGKLLEAQRLKMRTTFDLEMMEEMGFCNGIENYSRHTSGRPPGSRPYTLIDFFPKDFLTIIDESHVAVPQIGGMYEGDRSRKTVLVEHGFRLPSALDNRPLKFPNSTRSSGSGSTFRPRPRSTKWRNRAASPPSRSSAPPACSIPRSWSSRSAGRSTICSSRRGSASAWASACSSPR
jgi:excinuclease ABC subunit B